MILCIFCTESPSPIETDSEDEVIFNRILKVNKGNTVKALLLLGLSDCYYFGGGLEGW